MRLYRRFLQRLGRTRWFAWIGANVVTRIDKRFGLRWPTPSTIGTGLPVVYLTTTGRKSGKDRTSPLLYLDDGGKYVVAASNYGQAHHPGWSYNLESQPRATLRWRGGRSVPVTARRADPQEVQRYWPRFTGIWSGYESYKQRAAHREIKLYVLEPLET